MLLALGNFKIVPPRPPRAPYRALNVFTHWQVELSNAVPRPCPKRDLTSSMGVLVPRIILLRRRSTFAYLDKPF